FFSSRRRHTRFSRDWSSDVCSSDLKPSTSRPWSRLLSYRASSPVYWGVSPHLEATLTIRSTLPLWLARLSGVPSMRVSGISCSLLTVCPQGGGVELAR